MRDDILDLINQTRPEMLSEEDKKALGIVEQQEKEWGNIAQLVSNIPPKHRELFRQMIKDANWRLCE